MEERLSYSSTEKVYQYEFIYTSKFIRVISVASTLYLICKQDMVLLHHEMEVEYPDRQITEKQRATLLEFGKTCDGKTTTAMALTVGIPAAVGALVLFLQNCCLYCTIPISK